MILEKSPKWGFIDIIMVAVVITMASFLFSIWQEQIGQLLLSWGIPENGYTFFVSAYLVQFIVTVGMVYFFTVVVNKAQAGDIGFKAVSAAEFWGYGVGGGILLLTIVFLLSIPIGYLNPQLQPQLYEEMLRSVTEKSALLWLVFISVVLAPLSEEMFYRAMIYPVFRRYLGPTWAIIVAGSLFGLAHFDLWRFIPLAIGGMGLCYIYEKTRSLLVASVAHGVWNLIMTLIVYYSVNLT